ncbi:glycosyltransferase family 4 protein [Vibrio splendidus]
MKVLYVITKSSEIGGAQVHVRDLSLSLKKLGHEVIVVSGEQEGLLDILKSEGVVTFVVPCLDRNINLYRDFMSIISLIKIIRTHNPDLVGLHSSKAGILGRVAAKFCRKPVVFTAHGWAFADGISERKKQIYIFLERYFSRFANKIITVSEQDKLLAKSYRVSCDNKQVVIHNGVSDYADCKPVDTLPRNTINLIMVARLSDQKDHKILINAISNISHLNWHLTLVGNGPNLQVLSDLVNHLGLNGRVSFLGARSDVGRLLKSSDIFILTSKWEGFPMSILEAKSCGLPIIASNVGGVQESITHNTHGFLIERDDITQLTLCLEKLISSKELRTRFGIENRRDYESKYSVDKMFSKTFSLYEQVVND